MPSKCNCHSMETRTRQKCFFQTGETSNVASEKLISLPLTHIAQWSMCCCASPSTSTRPKETVHTHTYTDTDNGRHGKDDRRSSGVPQRRRTFPPKVHKALSERVHAIDQSSRHGFHHDGCCWLPHQVDPHSDQILDCLVSLCFLLLLSLLFQCILIYTPCVFIILQLKYPWEMRKCDFPPPLPPQRSQRPSPTSVCGMFFSNCAHWNLSCMGKSPMGLYMCVL